MKRIMLGLCFFGVCFSPSLVAAQESLVPAPEATPAKPELSQETLAREAAQRVVAFFQGLEQAVEAKQGDCAAMSEAMHTYYHDHKAWIASLDYATTNLDADTMAQIHDMALAFGKKLSACYDENSIPEQLHRYAGLGEEWQ